MWRGIFDEAIERRATSPKVGLMKLQPVRDEQKGSVSKVEMDMFTPPVQRHSGSQTSQ